MTSVQNYSPDGENSLLRRQRTSRTFFENKSLLDAFTVYEGGANELSKMFFKLDEKALNKKKIWKNHSFREIRRESESEEIVKCALVPLMRNFDNFYVERADKFFRGLRFHKKNVGAVRGRHRSLLYKLPPKRIKGMSETLGDKMVSLGSDQCVMDEIETAKM